MQISGKEELLLAPQTVHTLARSDHQGCERYFLMTGMFISSDNKNALAKLQSVITLGKEHDHET